MKGKTQFQCTGCGHQEPKWLGRCPECGLWNSFTEVAAGKPSAAVPGTPGAFSSSGRKQAAQGTPIPLSSIENTGGMRLDTGIVEMNRVLGGGLMRGSSVLIGGEPGIGKSTLMLQAAARLVSKGRVLYVSGEESPGQLRMRADRLKVSSERIEVLSETEVTAVMQVLEQVKPVLVIVDSIQTLYSREVNALPGTVSQIKVCTQELVEWARSRGSALMMVAHVTKEGTIAGPKLVEHMVDTVVSFEQASAEVRTLQAVKNRFGSVDEMGFFRMTEDGLAEVEDAASLFLTRRDGGNPAGVAVAPVFEGSRALLVEIQSLTVPAKSGISRIYSDRIDAGRVARVAAVLEKHLGLHLAEHDVYVNVAGGIRISEVGVELPLATRAVLRAGGHPASGPARRGRRGEPHRRGPSRARPGQARPRRPGAGLRQGDRPCPRGTGCRLPAPQAHFLPVALIQEAVKAAFSAPR